VVLKLEKALVGLDQGRARIAGPALGRQQFLGMSDDFVEIAGQGLGG